MPFFCILSPQGVALGWVNDCSFGAKFLNLMRMGLVPIQPQGSQPLSVTPGSSQDDKSTMPVRFLSPFLRNRQGASSFCCGKSRKAGLSPFAPEV
jgi:hypothetical protein